MIRPLLAKAALLAAIGPTLLAAAPVSHDTLLLAAHNRERVASGVPALDWDARLAADARAWASELAASGTFEHYEEVSDDPQAQGENLWMGTKGAYGVETMVGHWIEEKKDFWPGVFPNVSRTGDLADVGHYTQIMWRDTTHAGCAIVSNSEDDYLVCRYATSGNVEGERVF